MVLIMMLQDMPLAKDRTRDISGYLPTIVFYANNDTQILVSPPSQLAIVNNIRSNKTENVASHIEIRTSNNRWNL